MRYRTPMGGVWKFVWFRRQADRDPDRENGHYENIYIDNTTMHLFSIKGISEFELCLRNCETNFSFYISYMVFWEQPVSVLEFFV